MKIEAPQLKSLFHNVFDLEENDRGELCPKRFTPDQIKVLEANEAFLVRSRAAAGICIEMETDSQTLDIKFQLAIASSQDWVAFDLYVDGVLCDTRFYSDLSPTEIHFDLPEGMHNVAVYFPWTAQFTLKELQLSEGASWSAVQKKGRIIAFGDSITQGYISKLPSMSYPSQIARALDVEMLNQGVGGHCFEAETLCESLKVYSPDALIVAYGTNDYSLYDNRGELTQKATDYFNKLWELFPKVPTLVIAPLYRNDKKHIERQKYRNYTLDDVRDILFNLCGNREKTVFLRESGIPHVNDAFSEDFLHPNTLGFTFVAGAAIKALSSMINIT